MRKILTYPNPILRKVSIPLKPDEIHSEEIQFLIAELVETMKASDGIGLAAIQIGERRGLFVYETGQGVEVVINPRKICKRGEDITEESCLSLPYFVGEIKRPAEIDVEYINGEGNAIKRTLKGREARIFQHEFDHLYGVLLLNHVHWTKVDKWKKVLKKMRRVEKKKR